ncbi:hypothetical protein [Dechloromonas hortensis]|uniref:hypothetical protein n=1 Tax=Dechloromonas hortensis TaxID=337779 RepID=UPI001291883E|nr:hypothetical protein [Dechloromonas hortensis]
MKNVSERENLEFFQAFYSMVYELAAGELKDTQFIIIDKEMFPVPEDLDLELKFSSHHMAPGSREHHPLVPYYNVPEDKKQSPESDKDET